MSAITDSHPLPGRFQALVFVLKTRLLQTHRFLREAGKAPERHPHGHLLAGTPVIAEVRIELWNQVTADEFPLTAGKVANLRSAARALHALEIPAKATFSFWRQVGRTSRRRGFTEGRELREGCIVPAMGGGLCQLSGALHLAALKAGLEVVERHAHSRVVPGSTAEQGTDATLFWNYVDLRFRADFPWRMEVELDASHLIVRIRAAVPLPTASRTAPSEEKTSRTAVHGDCLSCGQTSCFRHPAATRDHAPALGHSTFLLDARWPEFDRWCAGHSRPGDRWVTPLDGQRWKKPQYAWHPPAGITTCHHPWRTLQRSWKQRRLPGQGAARQRALLEADAAMAADFARDIDPACRHLVVPIHLLPHLWRLGVFGGRTFDVLAHRWPLAELEARLDEAAAHHPVSPTLADFRAPADLIDLENTALARAARIITPHHEIARWAGQRAWLIDWEMPDPLLQAAAPSGPMRLFLPCSALGRKGIHEIAAALRISPAKLLILGKAREGGETDPLRGIDWEPAGLADLASCHALLLPAWVEHQPRLALRALSSGIPVIATRACGLPDHPLLRVLDRPDAGGLAAAIDALRPRPASIPAAHA